MSATTEHAHPHATKLKHDDGSWKYTNRLADETSPYLRQHAHNPVDWYPWGEAAFALARQQQKPIFLSIGYSTCYWCHVMERQVFENPTIAGKMNDLFINIKVDREERPDLDDIYMTATQLMTHSGGWPMSVFLTPPPPPSPEGKDSDALAHERGGLKPFWCGTYLPPEPMHGRPSFPQVLEALFEAWQTRRDEVLEQADKLADAVKRTLASEEEQPGPLDAEPVTAAARALLGTYDDEHGGFGGRPGQGPKFPQPSNLSFLFAVLQNNKSPDIAEALAYSLDRMARGGICDQVGGGFHRYSVDEQWLVPHFEKMLYDNGQLLGVYTRALTHERGRDLPNDNRLAFYDRVLRETADYVLREMTDDTGAFHSAQDAEVNAREGQNYLWTAEQIGDALDDPELSELALRMYGVDQGPNFQDPHAPDAAPANVLYLPKPLPELAEELGLSRDQLLARREQINAALYRVRQRRDQPGTDDKVLVGWNGLMIQGLAEAGAALNEPRYLEAAGRAADAILQHMDDPASEGGLLRTMRAGQAKVPAFLEDYALFVAGLIALHRAEARGERRLDQARCYVDTAERRFATGHGGYYDTLADQDDLFVRVRSSYDGAVPTGNAVMIHNLIDLYELTGARDHLDRAVRDLRSFAEPLRQRGGAMIHMQHALLRALEHAADALNAPANGRPAATGPAAEPVAAEARWLDDQTLRLTLDIASGYHIHGPDPEPPLVGTSVELIGPGSMEVSYPEGEEKTFPFADAPQRVYQGRTQIDARLTGVGEGSRLRLRVQPCRDDACLTPRTLDVTIPPR
jgi:uncharacterized protein YyaL (SSP411 family)